MDVVPDSLFEPAHEPVEPLEAKPDTKPETEAEEFIRVCAFLASLRESLIEST